MSLLAIVVSLAVLVGVCERPAAPAEQEVAEREAQHERQAQPHVVRHEHQHQQVGQRALHRVQQRLQSVAATAQRAPSAHTSRESQARK